MRRLHPIMIVFLAGCASSEPSDTDTGGDHTGDTDITGGLTVDDILGGWTADWAEMQLREEGGTVRGTYSHDEGTVVGTFADGVFTGWWCEAPSRAAPDDAGEVEFRFTGEPGDLLLDGRYRQGAAGDWAEDWDMEPFPGTPDAELEARFNEPGAFCTHP